MIPAIASEAHHADHIRPVLEALPPALRGEMVTDADRRLSGGERASGPVLVAAWGDLKRARALGYERFAFVEHGAGQSYGGQAHDDNPPPRKHCAHCHPAYPGGVDRDDVSLTLVPNEQAEDRYRERYADMDVRVVGCPKLDQLPARELDGRTVVAISFHMNAWIGCPEADSAWRWYRPLLPSLRKRFTVIGHSHPRHAHVIRPECRRLGIPFVEHFEDVCRLADLYVVDNSSTAFEFASTGRPVVLLNWPGYRKSVRHGLRFWDAAHVGLNVWRQQELEATIDAALADPPALQEQREAALRLVYPVRTGAAALAAAALTEWVASEAAAA